MKKFRFRLQPLLKLREQQEDQKKQMVGMLLDQIYQQQKEGLAMAAAIKQEGEELKRQYQQGKVDLVWIGHYRRYVVHLNAAIQQRIQKMAELQSKLQVARAELIEASRQTKILEKLKEKQKGRQERRVQKMEIRELDEMGVLIYARQSQSEL